MSSNENINSKNENSLNQENNINFQDENINKTTTSTVNLAKNAGFVGFATFISRIFGLIREQTFAAFFGAGIYTDAFNAAFRIPNLLRDLFAEGALSSAFVPVFSEYKTSKSKEETNQLANTVISALLILLGLICLIGIIYSDDIVKLMAKGFEKTPNKTEITILMTKIMFPFLILIAIAAIFMGMLNAYGYFFIPAFAPTLFNLGMIVSSFTICQILKFFGYPSIVGMAYGVLLGGFLQCWIQYYNLKKLDFKFKFSFNLKHEGLIRIFKLMLPATIGVFATQVNVFINTLLASNLKDGAISYLNYSFRLMQLPIGIFGVAISSVTLPIVSIQAFKNEKNKLAETITSSLILVFLLTLPATFGLIFLSEPIISLLYEHGKFTNVDTKNTAWALIGYSIGLFGYSAVKILAPIFYALNKTKFPVLASITAVICNIILNFLLINKLSYFGLALATSLSMILNFLILFLAIKFNIPELSINKIIFSFLKIGLTSFFMGLTLFYIYDGVLIYFKTLFFGFNTLYNLFCLCILIPLGITMLFYIGKHLNVAEINTLANVIENKLKKILNSLINLSNLKME